eukprot:2419359-Amphidinium_carterae.1
MKMTLQRRVCPHRLHLIGLIQDPTALACILNYCYHHHVGKMPFNLAWIAVGAQRHLEFGYIQQSLPIIKTQALSVLVILMME